MKVFAFLLFIGLSEALSVSQRGGHGLDEYHKVHYKPKDGKFEYDHHNIGATNDPTQMSRLSYEDKTYWLADGQGELEAQLAKSMTNTKAKNIIIFIGDGTSIGTMTAARLAKGYKTGNYEREVLVWETFPFTGIVKTYNTNMQVTDSAAATTAYSTGVKGNQGTIGVDVRVPLGSCPAMVNEEYHTQSVLTDFQVDGRSTGIVTTTRVTHASPAGNYAHTAERHWESDDDMNDEDADSETCDDIAEQLVLGETGKNIKVILGGGRKKFISKDLTDPENCDLKRDDGKDLVETWLSTHSVGSTAKYVWNRTDLLTLDVDSTDYLMGLFDCSHMAYHVDAEESNPSLAEMTTKAIEILQKDTKGFFLFVEGGMIDQAHHLNEARSAIEEAMEFEKAVDAANSMTSADDTLIIVTADHAQPMQTNGYTARNKNVLGLADTVSDVDGMLYSILMYTNGPGFRDQVHDMRPDVSDESWTDDHYVAASTIPNVESFHSGEDVVLFARGPQSHLFTGIHENSYIPAAFRYAACVGDGKHFCDL